MTNIIMLASPNPQISEIHLRIWLQHSVLSTLTVRYDTYTWNCALIRKYTIYHGSKCNTVSIRSLAWPDFFLRKGRKIKNESGLRVAR